MIDQKQNLCVVCGREAQHEHHIILRSQAPELIDDPKNKIWLCASCHDQAHHDEEFKKALQDVFFYWTDKNINLFLRGQASLEAILDGKDTTYFTPAMCAEYLNLASATYSYLSTRMGELEALEPLFITSQEGTHAKVSMLWKATEEGQEQIKLKRKLKALASLMSNLKANLRRFEMERYNIR